MEKLIDFLILLPIQNSTKENCTSFKERAKPKTQSFIIKIAIYFLLLNSFELFIRVQLESISSHKKNYLMSQQQQQKIHAIYKKEKTIRNKQLNGILINYNELPLEIVINKRKREVNLFN